MSESRSCYVVVPAGTGMRPLELAFQKLSLSALLPEHIAPAGETIPAELRTMMRSADFVLGVLDGSKESVLFEVGLAAGLKKPIFLVLLGGAQAPFSVQSFPAVRLDSLEDDVLVFHLRQFLQSIGKRSESVSVPQSKPVVRPSFSSWLSSRASVPLPERELENQVAEALEAAGVTTSIQPRLHAENGSPMRPDFVAWFDGMPESLGNPVVIEVKGSLGSSSKRAVSQVFEYMKATNSRSGLIITGRRGDERVTTEFVAGGCVFTLSTETLFNELLKGSLFDTLIKERNLASHEVKE